MGNMFRRWNRPVVRKTLELNQNQAQDETQSLDQQANDVKEQDGASEQATQSPLTQSNEIEKELVDEPKIITSSNQPQQDEQQEPEINSFFIEPETVSLNTTGFDIIGAVKTALNDFKDSNSFKEGEQHAEQQEQKMQQQEPQQDYDIITVPIDAIAQDEPEQLKMDTVSFELCIDKDEEQKEPEKKGALRQRILDWRKRNELPKRVMGAENDEIPFAWKYPLIVGGKGSYTSKLIRQLNKESNSYPERLPSKSE